MVVPHGAVQEIGGYGVGAGAVAILTLEKRLQAHEGQQNACVFVSMAWWFLNMVKQGQYCLLQNILTVSEAYRWCLGCCSCKCG